MCLWLIILIIWGSNAEADIFGTTQADENKPIVNAIDQDTHGDYYRQGMDYQINSQLNGGDHNFNGGAAQGVIPKGYGGFSIESDIARDLKNAGFRDPSDINTATQNNQAMNFIKMEYADPARADLLKYFTTLAMLKIIIRSQQYADLQRSVDDPIYKLSARSQLLCVNNLLLKPFNRNATGGSLVEAFKLCQGMKAFEQIPATQGVIKKSLGNIRGDLSAGEIIKITGDVVLSKDDYEFKAPTQHIGDLLEEERNSRITKISDLVGQYKSQRRVDSLKLSALDLPGLRIQEYQIRNLAMLEPNKSTIAIAQLASQSAYIKTIQQYSQADEYLRRSLENPNVDPAYKPIIQDRRQYIKDELNTLNQHKELTQDFARTMTSILDQADQERLKTIAQIGNGD